MFQGLENVELKPGELVCFHTPEADEDSRSMTVVEDRGPRVLVQPSGFENESIKPTMVYAKRDLKRAK